MHGGRGYICYTKADEAAAVKLHRALVRLSSHDVAFGPIDTLRLGDTPPPKATRFDIEASDFLILLCSPAALTPAMEDAAMIYKARGRGHRIIPVVTGGEPCASRFRAIAHRECLPRPLRFATDAKGALTDHAVRPDVMDFRSDGPGLPDIAAWIASRLTGAPVGGFHTIMRGQRQRRRFIAGVATAAALVALALMPALQRDRETSAQTATAREAGLAAHRALDGAQRLTAVNILTGVFPRNFDFETPPYPLPAEALGALSRAALETRELFDLPASVGPISALQMLPEGALMAVGADARTHLVDLGTGESVPVFRPEGRTASRVSADGSTLWTARFGDETQNGDGDVYTPLVFEDVDLASGDISLQTAVQSLPPHRGDAAISPDGARFAVDIGPGHGDQTLIAVFNRTEQSLAGVTTLPAGRAAVEFLSPDRVLLTINPQNPFGVSPGFYLWDINAGEPRVLRSAGLVPVCPGAGAVPRRAIEAELQAGRMSAADWTVSDDGKEIALLLPATSGGSCVLRWDTQTGLMKRPVRSQTKFTSIAFSVTNGPYAVTPPEGDLVLLGHSGETPLKGCQGPTHHFTTGGDPLILCEGDGATTLHHGYSGQRKWSGPPLPPLTAVTFDPLSQRIIMARTDGRLTVWDAAERGYQIVRTAMPITLAQPDDDHVAVLAKDAQPRFFDLVGRLTEVSDRNLIARVQPGNQPELLILTALTAPGAPALVEECEALGAPEVIHRSDSPSGHTSAIETPKGVAVYDTATCLPVMRLASRTVGNGPLMVSDDLLWAPLPGEISVFPLAVPPAEALASLHTRAARLATGDN